MGFRRHRRRGGGGGSGGGGGGGGGGGFGFVGGDPNGLQPGDDVGNRRATKMVQLPPEDIGNRRDPDEAEWVPHDDVGNRVDASPTHDISGVLSDLGGRGRRPRRPKGASQERVGRFLVGGVNPLIAGGTVRPFHGMTLDESLQIAGADPSHLNGQQNGYAREPSIEHDNGVSAVSESPPARAPMPMPMPMPMPRRTSRFFDFAEDDRFEYTLKSTSEQKRLAAEDSVSNIVREAGRDADVKASLLEDGTRPKLLVTIDERGPVATLPPERRPPTAGGALFGFGSSALMSLNYLVNKIINRYPDDRIRLAVLPLAEEIAYIEALRDHQKTRAPEHRALTAAGSGSISAALVPAPALLLQGPMESIDDTAADDVEVEAPHAEKTSSKKKPRVSARVEKPVAVAKKNAKKIAATVDAPRSKATAKKPVRAKKAAPVEVVRAARSKK